MRKAALDAGNTEVQGRIVHIDCGTLQVLLFPCFCLHFKYVGHVLRIHEFLDSRNFLSMKAESEHILVVVGLAGYSLAISEELQCPLTIELKKRIP